MKLRCHFFACEIIGGRVAIGDSLLTPPYHRCWVIDGHCVDKTVTDIIMASYRALTTLRMCLANQQNPNIVVAASSACLVWMSTSTRSKSYHCLSEPQQTLNRRRKRPPVFGSTIPTVTKRGIKTGLGSSAEDLTSTEIDIAGREDCPMCKKFGSGPCGEIFKRWLNCTDEYHGKDLAGEPLHLTKCIDLAEELGKCLDNHADHYSSKDKEEEDNKRNQQTHDHTLKDAWSDFVMEIEHGIKSKKFVTSPFSEKYNPSMQFKPSSKTVAAIFAPDMNGAPIVTAYIIDENDSLLAAGSKEDMDMGSFGCVLQFDVPDATKSVTCRVIYDSNKDDGDVNIFTRTMRVPRS